MHFAINSVFTDTSNVSVGDLGDILETETPPQSPTDDSAPSDRDTVTISMTTPSSSAVRYRRRGATSDVTEETDLESLSALSKVGGGGSVVPHGRTQSPPLPTSPTSSIPTSPTSPRARSPDDDTERGEGGGSGGFSLADVKTRKTGASKVKPITSPTETVALRQRDQPRRIAEYNRDSFTGEEIEGLNVSGEESGHKEASPPPTTATNPSPVPPMVKQKTEPALKYKPFQQVEPLMVDVFGMSDVPSPLRPGVVVTHPAVV